MTKVLDAAYPRWTSEALKAAHIVGVCRYLSFLPNTKGITRAEYDALTQAGVPVMLNWETSGKSWRNGHDSGFHEGQEARAQARALGHPDDRPIIQSMDEGVPHDLLGKAAEYQRGFNEGGGCGPQGAYGTGLVLDYLFDRGLIVVGWQTNARGWEGNGPDCARAALFQRTSHTFDQWSHDSYDENDVNHADWGQHPAPYAPPVPKEDDEVILIPSRAGGVVAGRVGTVYFDPDKKALVATNGVSFKSPASAFDIVQWKANDASISSTATLKLPFKGKLTFAGETPNGQYAVLQAQGDGGTFLVEFDNLVPLPPKPSPTAIDYAELAKHLEIDAK